MPSKDSQWTYVHMTHPHHVLYREKWIKDKLQFDDIDLNAILIQQQQKSQFQNVNFLKNAILVDDDEDDELNVPINQTQFGASRNRRKLLTNNVWKDLDLMNFLDSNADHELTKDHTILKPIDNNLYQRKTNPFEEEPSAVESTSTIEEEEMRDDLPDFVVQDESEDTLKLNNSNNNNNSGNSNGGSSNPSTTPLMTRARTREYYQTPVGRILR